MFLRLSQVPLAHFPRSPPLNSESVLQSDGLTSAGTTIPNEDAKLWAVKGSGKIQGAWKTKCINYAEQRPLTVPWGRDTTRWDWYCCGPILVRSASFRGPFLTQVFSAWFQRGKLMAAARRGPHSYSDGCVRSCAGPSSDAVVLTVSQQLRKGRRSKTASFHIRGYVGTFRTSVTGHA